MTDKPILILGATGQVGRALHELLGNRCIALTREQFDLSQLSQIEKLLTQFEVAAIINAAAYTDVDRAEDDEDLAMKVNGYAPGIIARWCASRNIPFIHYSTDYVYSGVGNEPWCEDDKIEPLNIYGLSKAEGDKQVASAEGRWLVFRTSYVYGATGTNFLTKMLILALCKEKIDMVNDQYITPTYAPQLATATLFGLEQARKFQDFPSGIYHLCNEGTTTPYFFLKAVLEKVRDKGFPCKLKIIKSIPLSEFPSKVNRPKNSRLNTSKVHQILDVKMPDWRNALSECMEKVSFK